MSSYSIKDISNNLDRFKLFILVCKKEEIRNCIQWLTDQTIEPVNIGKVLSDYIDKLPDFKYLIYDVYDQTKKILDRNRKKINNQGNDIVSIYNLGILMEPSLQLNAVQLLKEYSKTCSILLIWENSINDSELLTWENQSDKYSLDFSDIQIKRLSYEI